MEFPEDSPNVSRLQFACFVGKGQGRKTHSNRPGHGLAYHVSGMKSYTFSDGTRLEVSAGSLIYLPKNSSYTVSSAEEGECYAINFELSPDAVREPFIVRVKNTGLMLAHFREARETWEQKAPGFDLRCKALLYEILYALVQERGLAYAPQSKYQSIRAAVERIHAEYTREHISVEALADMCHFTPEYFRSLFKRFTGASPICYINELRISKARELLETGMYSVGEAARQSGYADMSHFCRAFKKRCGVCPSKLLSR